jgi:hypothetical protein
MHHTINAIQDGCTALIESCKWGFREIEYFLIESGARIDVEDKVRITSPYLHLFFWSSHRIHVFSSGELH